MKNFVIIDGNALVHRAFHAIPPLKTKKGEAVNAVYGFVSILFRVIKDLKPAYICVAFDLSGPTFRNVEYKEYKAKRVKAPQDLYDQLNLIKRIVKALKIPIYEKKGFEADDVIGTIACKIKKKKSDIKAIIISGDLDFLQLVDKKIELYTFKKGINQVFVYDKKAIADKYGLTPGQIISLKGLKGDASDNIPGVPAIGEKTALDLIRKFKNLENLYLEMAKSDLNPKLQARLLEYKDQAFFSQKLATIKCDVKINFNLRNCQWSIKEKDKNKITKILEYFNFNSLIRRLDEVISPF